MKRKTVAKQLPGKRITERRLQRVTGSEGPNHDPYSFTEYTVMLNGVDVTAHLGLDERLEVNGKTVARFEAVQLKFKEVTGIDLKKFDRYYDRVHPYFEDPMGHPSQYI